jgi:Flp pilus assembly protein CpaB
MNMQQPPFSMPGGVPGTPPGYPPADAPAPGKAKREKKAKAPKTPKSDRTTTAREQARRNALIALLLAVAAAVAAFVLVSKPEEQKVYVAKVANQSGLAAGRVVVPTDISYVLVPYSNVEPGAAWDADKTKLESYLSGAAKVPLADPTTKKISLYDWQVVGRRPKYPVLRAQQIHPIPVFADSFQLATPLGEDESLVTIAIPAERAVLGVLRAGDLVDVVAARTGEETTSSEAEPGTKPTATFGPGPVLVASKVEIVAVKSKAALTGQVDDGIPSVYLLRTSSDLALQLSNLDSDSGTVLYLMLRGHTEDATQESGD